MSRNGSGVYSLPAGQPVVTGTTISSATHNALMADIAVEITRSIASDGQTTPTANLPMGGFKLTGLAAGSVAGDSVRYEQYITRAPIDYPSLTGTLTHSGDIVLSGPGKRITGDFSNSPLTNRMLVQTSVANSFTNFGLIPNGTNQISMFRAYNNSDPTNAAYVQLEVNSNAVSLASGYSGTGAYLPLTFTANGGVRMSIGADVSLSATPTTGDRSTKVATTAMFTNEFMSSIAASGYQKLPSGLIIQWGVTTSVSLAAGAATTQALTFPLTFPNAVLAWSLNMSSQKISASFASIAADRSGATIAFENVANSGNDGAVTGRWFVIGY